RGAELEALRSRSAAHREAIARALAALGETVDGTEEALRPSYPVAPLLSDAGLPPPTARGLVGWVQPTGKVEANAAGLHPPYQDRPLGPLRDRAEAIVSRLAKAAARRDELLQSIGQIRRQVDAARAQLQAAGDRLRAWRQSWARAVAPLGLPPEAAPE